MVPETRESTPRRQGTANPRLWVRPGLRAGKEGAALITALGMLFIFVALGTAYVRYMSLEVLETRADIEGLRTHHLAQGGIYAAIGEIEAAVQAKISPRLLYHFEPSVYLPKSEGLVGYPQKIDVTVTDESGRDTLEGAFRSAGTETNVIRTIIKNTNANTEALRKWKASRCYRIVSEAEVQIAGRTTRSAVEAVVTLDEMGTCHIRFWKETRLGAEIEDAPDEAKDAPPDEAKDVPDEAKDAPDEATDDDATQTIETKPLDAVQTTQPAAGRRQGAASK